MVQHLLSGRDAIGTSPYRAIVEQPAWWGPLNYQRGELVHLPTAPNSNEWHCWRLNRNPKIGIDAVDCRVLNASYLFKYYEGEYLPPDVANPAYSFPGGNWNPGNYTTSATIYSSLPTKPLVLTVPAGTKKLYILTSYTTDGRSATMSMSGSGVLNYTSYESSEIMTAQQSEFEGWVLLATDCGGSVITRSYPKNLVSIIMHPNCTIDKKLCK